MRFSKHTEAETFDRKELVKALAVHLGVRSVYNGMPSRSYKVGPYTIEGDGSIVGDDITPLRDFLIENGYAKAEDFEAQAETPEVNAENAIGEVEENAVGEAAGDSEAPHVTDDDGSFMVIGMPVPDMTTLALKNLVFMLYTKQYLLNRAFGEPQLRITEKLVTRLQEYTPESLEEFERILKDAWSLDELQGFSYEDGKVTMAFPQDEHTPEKWTLYADLLARIVHCAMSTRRTRPVLQKPENERYFMYSWLIRLGCGGPDSRALRRLMIGNLDGYCAFPDESRAQKHRDRCKEIRRIRKEVNEEADRR